MNSLYSEAANIWERLSKSVYNESLTVIATSIDECKVRMNDLDLKLNKSLS